MPVDISVRGAYKFRALARALKETGDKDLRKELYAGMSRAVKPLTAALKDSAPRYLPGRYAIELSKSLKVRPRRRAGRDPGLRLRGTAKTPAGKDRNLAALNRGRLRHPLYGDRNHWYEQRVRPLWWDEPLRDNAEPVRQELERVLDELARKLARKL